MKRIWLMWMVALLTAGNGGTGEGPLAGWTTGSPREEIAPLFEQRPGGGPDGQGSLVIRSDGREGVAGWWTREFAVEGGTH